MQRIAVIDYGMGNLRSVAKACEAVSSGAEIIVTSDAETIGNADRIVCPGQGAARDCMSALRAANLCDVIRDCVADTPFLGICMGLQVLLTHSDENNGIDCLNLLPGKVVRFDSNLRDERHLRLKVPHMGWSEVSQSHQHDLWRGIAPQSRFYFAHSYYVVPDDPAMTAAECKYGTRFSAALLDKKIFACQFHPEKSADAGLKLLKNFTQWSGN